MKRFLFALVALLSLGFLMLASSSVLAQEKSRPNILFLFADDFCYETSVQQVNQAKLRERLLADHQVLEWKGAR